jgi:hypothetical protein
LIAPVSGMMARMVVWGDKGSENAAPTGLIGSTGGLAEIGGHDPFSPPTRRRRAAGDAAGGPHA